MFIQQRNLIRPCFANVSYLKLRLKEAICTWACKPPEQVNPSTGATAGNRDVLTSSIHHIISSMN
jgi:hypothetical protein